jgi:hypothetical protein
MRSGLRRALRAAPLAALALLTYAGGVAGAAPSLNTVAIPNVGPGYAVISQGPLNAEQFASSSPDPSAAARALSTLAGTIDTFQRVWQDASMRNEVQDLVVRFPSGPEAQTFLAAVQHSLSSGEIVSAKTLPEIPGALRTTYFAVTSQVGVGQAISMRNGRYVVLLSTFSADAGNAQPITETDAIAMALAQRTALVAASGSTASAPARVPSPGSALGLAALVIAVFLVPTLILFWLRRRLRR